MTEKLRLLLLIIIAASGCKSEAKKENIPDLNDRLLSIMHGELFYSDVYYYIQKGADPNAVDKEGNTLLMKLSNILYEDEAVKIGRLLLSKGADVNFANNKGLTALMIASKSFRFQLVKLFIENEAEINARDNDNWTALKHALYLDSVRALVEKENDTLYAIIDYLRKNGAID